MSGVAVVAMLTATPVLAQTQEVPPAPTADSDERSPAPAGGNDIVVTARRTAERLQDVPIAVTAFGAAALEDRNVATLDEIAKFTPNIRFDGAAALSGGNYNATVFVRGVGQNDFAIFSDPGVGFYVDDVYYARSIGGVMDAVDIDSVQVLRGPQGTLFGKNTIGGAVIVNTAAPDLNTVTGRIEGTYGRFDRIDVKGAVNVPLVPGSVALRLSGATLNRDGYVKRLIDGDTQGDRSAQMIRAKLRIAPEGSGLTVDLGADYTRARETSAPSDLLAVGNQPGITGVPFLTNYNRFVAPSRGVVAPNGQPTLNPSFITASPFETYATGPNDNDLDLWGVQGTIAYDLGSATLKSISAYRDMKAYFTRDGDNSPFLYRQTTNRDKQWQFSQELQLLGKMFDNRLSYVLGGYYFKEKASDIATADLAIGLSPPLALTPPYTPAVFIRNYTNNRSLAAYGQVDFEIVPRLTLTVGGRYTSDKKTFTSINVRQRDLVQFVNVTKSATFEKFTPRLGITYKASSDLLLYASYARGFKQGGFNGRPLVSDAEVTQYAPEELTTYEAGIKAQWLDGQLTTNLAAFHSLYRDIQLTVNQTPTNFVANAASGKLDGLEFETIMRPASWLSFNAAVGYLDARYTSIGAGLGPTQILPITLASHFVKAPEWTVTTGLDVSHEFADASEAALRVDYTLYSRIYHDVANSPIITDDGYGLLNARLSYTLPGKAVTLAVFGTNLTNTLYLVSGNVSGAFGLAEASYGRPARMGRQRRVQVLMSAGIPPHAAAREPTSLNGGTDPRLVLDAAPMSRFQWGIVATMVGLNALDGFDVLSISFASPGIAAAWGIDRAALGVVLSMELLGMAAGSLVLGGLADRLGRRITILACLCVMAGGMLGASFARDVTALSLWRVMTGLGIGGMLAATNAAVAEAANARRRALCVVLMAGGYPVGSIIGGAISAVLLTRYDWPAVFQFGAAATLCFIPLVLWKAPESIAFLIHRRPPHALARVNATLARMGHTPFAALPEPSHAPARVPLVELFAPSLAPATVLLTVAYLTHIMTFYFILKWIPKIVVDMGFAPSMAAGVLVWASVGGASGSLTFGLLTGRIRLFPLTITVMILAALLVVMFGQGQRDLASLSVIAGITGFATNAGVVGLYALIAQTFPTAVRATATGFVIGVGRGGSAPAPALAGLLFAIGYGLSAVAALMALGSIIAALTLFALWRRGGKTDLAPSSK